MRVSSTGASFDSTGGSTSRMINNNVFEERVVHFRNVPWSKAKLR
jgi:hypothetical protein